MMEALQSCETEWNGNREQKARKSKPRVRDRGGCSVSPLFRWSIRLQLDRGVHRCAAAATPLKTNQRTTTWNVKKPEEHRTTPQTTHLTGDSDDFLLLLMLLLLLLLYHANGQRERTRRSDAADTLVRRTKKMVSFQMSKPIQAF